MKKKMLSLLLTVAMTATMVTGCGNTDNGGTPAKESTAAESASTTVEESKDTAAETTADAEDTDSVLKDGNVQELVLLTHGTDQPDREAVEAAMNEEISKYVDAKITLKAVDFSNTESVNLMLASGEAADILVYANTNVLRNMALRGQLLPLDDLMNVYAKDAVEATGYFKDACCVNGEHYGLTSFRDLASSNGLNVRKDWFEETGMTADDIKNWDDVETLFEKVREKHPDAYMVTANPGSPILDYAAIRYDKIIPGAGCRMDDNDGHIDIVNVYATEDYKEMAERAYKWNQAGYLPPDPTTQTVQVNEWLEMGQMFSAEVGIHPGMVYEMKRSTGVDMVSLQLEHNAMTGEACGWLQWTIPSQCVAPEKAMAIINLFYSNADLVNLYMYGIEGKDYTFVDKEKGLIDVPADTGWQLGAWTCGNSKIGYVPSFYPENINELWDEYNKNADKSPLFGFVFDNTNVKSEVTAVENVVSKYRAIVGCGVADPDETLAKVNEELEAAGIQKVIDEMQKQVDEWQSSQN